MIQIGVWVVAVMTVVLGAVNAAYMLVSPSAWLGLPEWLRIRKWGVKNYGQGLSATQIRVMGVVFLAGILLIGYVVLTSIRA